MTTTQKCPECGYPNFADAKVCRRCKINLTDRCPDCGHPKTPGSHFCSHCGSVFDVQIDTSRYKTGPVRQAPPEPEPAPMETPSAPKSKNRPLKKCPECRHAIDAEATFCIYCGHVFENLLNIVDDSPAKAPEKKPAVPKAPAGAQAGAPTGKTPPRPQPGQPPTGAKPATELPQGSLPPRPTPGQAPSGHTPTAQQNAQQPQPHQQPHQQPPRPTPGVGVPTGSVPTGSVPTGKGGLPPRPKPSDAGSQVPGGQQPAQQPAQQQQRPATPAASAEATAEQSAPKAKAPLPPRPRAAASAKGQDEDWLKGPAEGKPTPTDSKPDSKPDTKPETTPEDDFERQFAALAESGDEAEEAPAREIKMPEPAGLVPVEPMPEYKPLASVEAHPFKTNGSAPPGMVLIPDSDFPYGRKNKSTKIAAFYADIHPVTNEQYRKFVEATGWLRLGTGSTDGASGVWKTTRWCGSATRKPVPTPAGPENACRRPRNGSAWREVWKAIATLG
ncbi:MAG: zinc ribbon domain-containing protein [Deltaproteobacteria bacterium]|nr:zinc ribbon domain-containing protein [Deltaproteobacteria bacterium]